MKLREYINELEGPGKVDRFAKLVGISSKSIYKYMRGERFPSPWIIQKIQSITAGKVNPADFYDPPPSTEIVEEEAA